MRKLKGYDLKDGAWRSLVAHLLWEQGVGGSNPLAPTIKAFGTDIAKIFVSYGK